MRREKMLLKNQKDAQRRQGLDNGWVCGGREEMRLEGQLPGPTPCGSKSA